VVSSRGFLFPSPLTVRVRERVFVVVSHSPLHPLPSREGIADTLPSLPQESSLAQTGSDNACSVMARNGCTAGAMTYGVRELSSASLSLRSSMLGVKGLCR
jgi:hypothetical protein